MRLLCSDRDSGVILGLIRVLLDFICSNGSARIVDITSTREAFGTAFIDSGTTYTLKTQPKETYLAALLKLKSNH